LREIETVVLWCVSGMLACGCLTEIYKKDLEDEILYHFEELKKMNVELIFFQKDNEDYFLLTQNNTKYHNRIKLFFHWQIRDKIREIFDLSIAEYEDLASEFIYKYRSWRKKR